LHQIYLEIYEIISTINYYHENALVYSIARFGGGSRRNSYPPTLFHYSIARIGGGAETGSPTTNEPIPYSDSFHL